MKNFLVSFLLILSAFVFSSTGLVLAKSNSANMATASWKDEGNETTQDADFFVSDESSDATKEGNERQETSVEQGDPEAQQTDLTQPYGWVKGLNWNRDWNEVSSDNYGDFGVEVQKALQNKSGAYCKDDEERNYGQNHFKIWYIFKSDGYDGFDDDSDSDAALELSRFRRKLSKSYGGPGPYLDYHYNGDNSIAYWRGRVTLDRTQETALGHAASLGNKEAQLEYFLFECTQERHTGNFGEDGPSIQRNNNSFTTWEVPSYATDVYNDRQAGLAAQSAIKMLKDLCDDEDPEALNMKGVLLLVPDLTDFVNRAINDMSMTFDNPKDSVSYVAHVENFPWWTSFPEIMSNPPESGEAISGSNVAFGCIKRAAKAGFAPAQRNLGVCYQYGICTAVDRDAALEWYQKAEDSGDTEAKTLIANLKEGKNANKFDIYLEAANRGDSKALATVARCYAEGDGVEQDYTKANEYWQKLADKGDPDALYRLGINYSAGIGVEKDREKGSAYFAQALDKDYGGGKYQQSFVTYSNLNDAGIEKEFAAAIGLNVPEDLYNSAINLKNRADKESNLDGLLKLLDAYSILGFCYASGQHDEIQDCKKAFEYLLRGAESGNGDAQWALSEFCRNGWGFKKDENERIRWLTMAADGGSPKGLVTIIDFYFSDGVGSILDTLLSSDSKNNGGPMDIKKGDFLGGARESNFTLAAKYLEKLLEVDANKANGQDEKHTLQLKSFLAVCYLGLNLEEAQKENPDQQLIEERAQKVAEITKAALEKNIPNAYFCKFIIMLGLAASGQEDIAAEELNRLESQLKQLSDSGDMAALQILQRLSAFTMMLQIKGIMIEGMGGLLGF